MALISESLSMLANASARARPASDNSASLPSSAFSAWRTMKTVDWLKELESAKPTRKQQSTKRFVIEQLYHEPREVDASGRTKVGIKKEEWSERDERHRR